MITYRGSTSTLTKYCWFNAAMQEVPLLSLFQKSRHTVMTKPPHGLCYLKMLAGNSNIWIRKIRVFGGKCKMQNAKRKTQIFCPNPKFSPKPKVFARIQNFCPNPKFWPEPKIFPQTQNFGPNQKFSPKPKIFAQTKIFCGNPKFLPEPKIFTQT